MKYRLPKTNEIIGYKSLFSKGAPTERLDLIRHISKDILILELAGLNYRLKGRLKKESDTKFTTQQDELLYFCGKNQILYNKYSTQLDQVSKGRKVFVFTRQACLFGIEEIIQSDIPVLEDFKMGAPGSWTSILLYILCLNDEITRIKDDKKYELINFETLSPKLLPLAELGLFNDPFYVVHRGFMLMEYLANHIETKKYIVQYFAEKYNLTYSQFIFELHRMWMTEKSKIEILNFHFNVPQSNKFKYLFDVLSEKFESSDAFKLLNIRKNPFYKRDENNYILVDYNILLEKAYQQFTNDFWFDKLKHLKKTDGSSFEMKYYKAIIGYFFEQYVDDKISYSFKSSKAFVVKTFGELKVGKQSIEIGDVYIRQEGKLILGEVKSTSLYDKEKYSGNVDTLYKSDRNEFFKGFGVDQVVKFIKNIEINIESIDSGFSKKKKLRIWPVIIFNEKALQTLLMAQIFNKRFQELMSDYDNKKIHLYPLSIIHISDLENMECLLNQKPAKIWELLNYNVKQKKFIPPFYNTLNRNDIRANYIRVREKISHLFREYDNFNVE